uniref:Uncharacterized protein n=1 Tax=Schizaphis graminum TaxID=13262 RepID=A0A2S2NF39_SCHGA
MKPGKVQLKEEFIQLIAYNHKKIQKNQFYLYMHFVVVTRLPYLLHSIETFYDPIASKDNICKAGEMFILALYNASEKETNLNNYRYQCFAKNVSCSKNVLLTLPPSEAAAREHSFRVYHQIQMWLGNKKNTSGMGLASKK